MLTGYKLIVDSGNQNKTCDKALWLFLLQNAIRIQFEFQIFVEFKIKIHIRMQNAAFEF